MLSSQNLPRLGAHWLSTLFLGNCLIRGYKDVNLFFINICICYVCTIEAGMMTAHSSQNISNPNKIIVDNIYLQQHTPNNLKETKLLY